jgi:molybdenum cofactor biosynthesis enzyme MoaA
MRLTSDGYFKPCLFDSRKYDIRESGIESAFLKAVENKPLKGTADKVNEFYNIGG